MPGHTLVCCAFPFGYGPAAKLLHVARRLRGTGLRLIFLGRGIAHELVARSNLFADILQAGPDQRQAHDLIRSAVGVLSLMDRDYAPLALELGRPLYVADSLLWMRDQVPLPWRSARRCWAQHFPGVPERLAEVGSNATLVGPIVAAVEGQPERRGNRVVVNLGGCEAPPGLAGSESCYFDFVFRNLVESGLLAAQGRGTVLLAGANCIRYLRSRDPGCGLEMLSASHEETTARLSRAGLVLTAPGLTATLECFQVGVPTYFLPPQNYSQWWILKTLRARGLAPGSFHWEDLLPGSPITERMPEGVRGPLVRDAIRGLAGEDRAAQMLREGLTSALAGGGDKLALRQRAFFDALGPNGAERIAEDLAELC
jgi:hypothetical protein